MSRAKTFVELADPPSLAEQAKGHARALMLSATYSCLTWTVASLLGLVFIIRLEASLSSINSKLSECLLGPVPINGTA